VFSGSHLLAPGVARNIGAAGRLTLLEGFERASVQAGAIVEVGAADVREKQQ
jgi:hypothetical protein